MNSFLKGVPSTVNSNTKIVKIFSKKQKTKQKIIYCSNKLLKCTGDIKKQWNGMKDITGKSKRKSANLPRKRTVNKVDVYNSARQLMLSMISLQILVKTWPVSTKIV